MTGALLGFVAGCGFMVIVFVAAFAVVERRMARHERVDETEHQVDGPIN